MTEIAVNIESKVSIEEFRAALDEKLTRSELSLRMQEKVSFEDMKRYISLNGGVIGGETSGNGPAAGQGPMSKRQFELINEEIRRLKEKVEDTFHQVQSLRQIGGGPSSQRDHSSFQKEVNAKFIEIDAKLTDKANKTTVAQALHRKANKPELEAILAKKVDFEDLQRILDSKVDIGSFQNLVRTVDYKADKHEILQHNLSLQHHQNASHEQTAAFDRAELERIYSALKMS